MEIGLQDDADDQSKVWLLYQLYRQAHQTPKELHLNQLSPEAMFVILKTIVGTNMTDEKLKKIIRITIE